MCPMLTLGRIDKLSGGSCNRTTSAGKSRMASFMAAGFLQICADRKKLERISVPSKYLEQAEIDAGIAIAGFVAGTAQRHGDFEIGVDRGGDVGPDAAAAAGEVAAAESIGLVDYAAAIDEPVKLRLADQAERPAPIVAQLEQTGRAFVPRTLAIVVTAQEAATAHPITGAVNVSAKLLSSAEFLTALRALVDDSGIDPHRLTFEVTESAAMSDPEGAAAALRSFSELGIGISMDDYGAGQSTLSYIKQLPLNELKIDRSFVQFAHQNRGDGVLVRSTIELAHELGLKVVAEGVEDEACLDFLREAGCDYVQGYFVSRPVTAEALFPILTDWRAAA